MAIKNGLLSELSHEKNNTLKVLNNLKGADFTFKPHVKSMSLGQLTNHVVELHNWVALALQQDVFDFHTDYTPSTLADADALIQVLESGYVQNKALIEAMDEADYFKEWTLKAGDHIIATLPKAGALRYIINNHLIHHRGQLTVYMRLLDIPVPGLYGPSADDK
ncbi:MAG: DinB family protein [Flavobacterium sp.]|nr:DinB family protein [Candidatus Neoflavobacterium equi]